MKVIKLLKYGVTLEELKETLGIEYTFNNDESLVILNYNQIDSPKSESVVRECRGLCLENKTWKLVARSFERFFNLGEMLDITNKFIWTDFNTLTKEDGSLMTLYNYKGWWKVNTRGSFADQKINSEGPVWSELFFSLLEPKKPKLHPKYSYVFELCSRWNKVVRDYPEPKIVLLSIFDIEKNVEMSDLYVDTFARLNNIERPERFYFKNAKKVMEYIDELEFEDPTNEGVVVKDCNGLRLKIKNKKYLTLHHMKNNGNEFLTKNMIPWIIDNETDELLAYFPEVKPKVDKITEIIEKHKKDMIQILNEVKDIEDQKEFALQVVPKAKNFGKYFFQLKKSNNLNEESLLKMIHGDVDGIYKTLFKEKNLEL